MTKKHKSIFLFVSLIIVAAGFYFGVLLNDEIFPVLKSKDPNTFQFFRVFFILISVFFITNFYKTRIRNQ